MALELAISPIMIPLAVAEATLCHFHRQSSRYNPNCVPIDTSNTRLYTVVPLKPTALPTGVLNKLLAKDEVFQVIDVETGVAVYEFRATSKYSKAIFDFVEAYKPSIKTVPLGVDASGTSSTVNNDDEKVTDLPPIATISAGIWSTIDFNKSANNIGMPHFYQGVNQISHQSDFLDNYRVFELSDGNIYQWTKRGMFLERVYNLGQKDSEIRERCGGVMMGNVRRFYESRGQSFNGDYSGIGQASQAGQLPIPQQQQQQQQQQADFFAVVGGSGTGFSIEIDESKVDREVALMTAMVSFLDHWNTLLGVGGVYYKLKTGGAGEVPWRRISRH
ncbi:uncharacterized protein SAPINGB_P004540 [Magnusiomyces paraingens]|uniref:Phospholipid scramblase n=1 Tax=Magnusiomyces paraingens TaxID=2606893 RepID=A0A5E8C2H1_9ASCO|nr:uncharacterized protein SAPINGB_P004540 [Saprochaete ingens]VVT55325.1 unnamed protein product [Saprochaete ingens]